MNRVIRHRQFPFLRIIVWTGFVKAREWNRTSNFAACYWTKKIAFGGVSKFRRCVDGKGKGGRVRRGRNYGLGEERERGLKSWIGQVRVELALTVKPCCVYLLELMNRWFITTGENWTVQMHDRRRTSLDSYTRIRRIDPRITFFEINLMNSKNENFWIEYYFFSLSLFEKKYKLQKFNDDEFSGGIFISRNGNISIFRE